MTDIVDNSKPLTPQGAAVEPVAIVGADWTLLYIEPRSADARALRDQLKPGDKLYAAPQPAAPAWTCFHCDETFIDRDAASLHFGTHMHQQPGCTIDLPAYREMEALQARYLEEDTDTQRAMARMQSDHAQALRRAEEAGYAKGVKDAEAEVAAPAQVAGSEVRRITKPMEPTARVPDDFRNQASGYRSGWNDCLECVKHAPPAALNEPFDNSERLAGVVGLSSWVLSMKKSDGTFDHFSCVGRSKNHGEYLSVHCYSILGRAEYEVAEWNHLLGLGPKPDFFDFQTEPEPAAQPAPSAGETP